MATIVLRQNTTTPVLSQSITDANGNAVNLTGATVTFVMRALTSNTPVVSNSSHVTITNAAAGQVTYNWQAADTGMPGIYQAEFQVTLSGGGTYAYPNDGYLEISIEQNLSTPGGATLVALGDVKDYLNLPTSDTSRDAELMRFIYGVAPVITGLVGDVLQQEYDEWYDGGQFWIRLRHRPVLQLMAVSEYRGPIEYPLAIIKSPANGNIYSCMLDQDGRVTRRTSGGGIIAFPAMPNSVHAVYVAGMTSVPQNVRLGTLELIRVNFQQTQQGVWPDIGSAMPSDNIGETHLEFFVPNRVRELLAPNRRAPSVF